MKKWMLIAVLWTSFSATMFGVTHIYSGRYAYASETLYTWDGKHLYKGRYAYPSEILLTTDGPVPLPILLMAQLL